MDTERLLERPWILEPTPGGWGGPGTNPPQISRDDYIYLAHTTLA